MISHVFMSGFNILSLDIWVKVKYRGQGQISRSNTEVKANGQGQIPRSRSGILHYAHPAEWSIYGLGLLSAKENHQDTWNTVQDFCVFVSNRETFAIKSCAQQSGAFNLF